MTNEERFATTAVLLGMSPRPGTKQVYSLEQGDKWCWIDGHIVVANAEKIPFTINLETGEIKEIRVQP